MSKSDNIHFLYCVKSRKKCFIFQTLIEQANYNLNNDFWRINEQPLTSHWD